MKVLIIGASGFLGKQLMNDFTKKHEVIGTFNSKKINDLIHLDITNEKEVQAVLEKIKPDITILSSAITDLNFCEANKREASRVNVSGVKNVVKHNPGKIVLLSTDYVFDGKKGNYNETDITNPKTVYGKSKLSAEKLVQEKKDFLIIRSSMLYSSDKENPKFFNFIINNLLNGEEINVVSDIFASPTSVHDLSNSILKLVEKNQKGIYHVVGNSQDSLYNYALSISKILDVGQVNPTTSKKLEDSYASDKKPALSLKKRPKNTTLNIDKLKSLGIKMKSLDEGIKEIITQKSN